VSVLLALVLLTVANWARGITWLVRSIEERQAQRANRRQWEAIAKWLD
jgi:hypothetical protein